MTLRVRNYSLLAAMTVMALPLGAPAQATDASSDRLLHVLERIDREYVKPVDWCPLIGVAIDTMRARHDLPEGKISLCVPPPPDAKPGQGLQNAFEPLADALALIGNGRDPAKDDAMADAVISAMLAALDKDSLWLHPEPPAEPGTGDKSETTPKPSLAVTHMADAVVFRLDSLPNTISRDLGISAKGELQQAKSIILDLRGNPGGTLDEAVKVADAFLDTGQILMTHGRYATDISKYGAQKGQLAPRLPVVVLVDAQTASGAEIIAAALQDIKRALIIGCKTYGRGTIQTWIPFDGRHALKLTTSEDFRPNGAALSAAVTPDIESDLTGQALIAFAADLLASRSKDSPKASAR